MASKNNKEVKITNFSNGKGTKIDVYSPNSRTKPHDSVHVKVNYDTKTYSATTKINGNKQKSSGGCYLTAACINYLSEYFDDNCYELTVLRWFRDNYVSQEDIDHYYKIAPIIVEAIDELPNKNEIYNEIYENVIEVCIDAIENGNYELAYETYQDSILILEEYYVRPKLEKHLVHILSISK